MSAGGGSPRSSVPQGSPAFVARHLSVAYGPVLALEDVDLEVPRGRTVAVLGPNGAGKSTLFEAAVGLIEAHSGSLQLADDRIAYVPQRLDLEPSFPVTVADVVGMGRWGELGWWRQSGRRDRELCDQALEALGISDLATRRLGELSSGQRQRALLAQAVAQDAQTLLLDEPLSGLDRPTAELVGRLIAGWREQGRTVLVATHDLQSVTRDFDLVLCLNRRVVAFGEARQTTTPGVLRETFGEQLVQLGESLVEVVDHHQPGGPWSRS